MRTAPLTPANLLALREYFASGDAFRFFMETMSAGYDGFGWKKVAPRFLVKIERMFWTYDGATGQLIGNGPTVHFIC